jgi:hypothetical protein
MIVTSKARDILFTSIFDQRFIFYAVCRGGSLSVLFFSESCGRVIRDISWDPIIYLTLSVHDQEIFTQRAYTELLKMTKNNEK